MAYHMNRRNLLRASACATAGLIAGLRPAFAADADIEVSPQAAGPEINPHLYGHFIEHLGGVIYDGIWVGRNSKIPNVDGIRRQFVEDMKRISVPNYRWPGGCFADGYHWRDGIGRAARPRTYNYWQSSVPPGRGRHRDQSVRHSRIHPSVPPVRRRALPRRQHGLRLARRKSTTGYEYCNAPLDTVSLAAERAANGDQALRRSLVGRRQRVVGMRRRHDSRTNTPCSTGASSPSFPHTRPSHTSSPSVLADTPRPRHGLDDRLLRIHAGRPTQRRSMDSRCTSTPTSEIARKRSPRSNRAAGTTSSAKACARKTSSSTTGPPSPNTIPITAPSWSSMSGASGIIPAKKSPRPTFSASRLTLRDALHTAVTFDIMNRHADKIVMANVAQTINCIHSLFLAQGDRFTRTPVYYVFEMYRDHMGAQLRIRCACAATSSPCRRAAER